MEKIKFNNKFREEIRNNLKTATIRYWEDKTRVLPGEPVTFTDEGGEALAVRHIKEVLIKEAEMIVKHGVDGHRDYDSILDFYDEMDQYYDTPEGGWTPETEFVVIKW